jgi:hypothetical protein
LGECNTHTLITLAQMSMQAGGTWFAVVGLRCLTLSHVVVSQPCSTLVLQFCAHAYRMSRHHMCPGHVAAMLTCAVLLQV